MSILGAFAAGTDAVSAPQHRFAACTPDVLGTFTIRSRSVVPIGAAVTRHFEMTGRPANGVTLSAPPEYNAQQLPASDGYNLRLTAPHSGDFAVQATWSQADGNGGTCTGSATFPLSGTAGSRIAFRPPRGKRNYANPMAWTWSCRPDSDPMPATATVRWETDARQLRPFSRGGKAPFRFRTRAKAFAVTVGDLCDAREAQSLVRKLKNNAALTIDLGRGDANQGAFYVGFKAASGTILGAHGRSLALHLAVTLKQGRRLAVNTRACAWSTGGFEVARGKNVSCWW